MIFYRRLTTETREPCLRRYNFGERYLFVISSETFRTPRGCRNLKYNESSFKLRRKDRTEKRFGPLNNFCAMFTNLGEGSKELKV